MTATASGVLRKVPRLVFSPVLVGLATWIILGSALEAAIHFGFVNAYVVPPPSAVIGAFGRIITEEHVLTRVALTAAETFAASALMVIIGLPLAFLLFRVALLRDACESWFAALSSAPLVLAYPLFLVLFGRSAFTVAAIGFAFGIAPVVLKTIEGLSAVRPTLINVGLSLGLTQSQMFRKILLPAALPTIFVGVKLGLMFSLLNIVAVEFLVNFGGLGQLINDLAERYDLPGTYAAICSVILVSVCFFIALERAEAWLRSHS
jgi:NitT/TauT family transport system permease protein